MISSKILYEINQKMKNFADTYVLQLYGRSGYFTNEWGKETYVRFYSNDDQRSVLERMYPNNKKMVEKRLTSYDEFWKGCFPGGISILVDSEKVFKDVKANGFIDGVVCRDKNDNVVSDVLTQKQAIDISMKAVVNTSRQRVVIDPEELNATKGYIDIINGDFKLHTISKFFRVNNLDKNSSIELYVMKNNSVNIFIIDILTTIESEYFSIKLYDSGIKVANI